MLMRPMRHFAAAALLCAGFTAPAFAETPADTLVEAWQIDDIISLDPAEIFEFSTSEIAGNTYERLIGYDLNDVSKMFGVVAESWTVSDDGKTITFKIREGRKFASGNPITAEDVVFSLQRAIKLDKSPAFIIGQFGLTADNVDRMIKQTGDYEFTFTMDKPYAPSFVLYCLTATVASVVDKKVVDGARGERRLRQRVAEDPLCRLRPFHDPRMARQRSRSCWSGTTTIPARWRRSPASSTATSRRRRRSACCLRRAISTSPATSGPEELAAVSSNPDIKIQSAAKGTIYYFSLNQKNPTLAKPEVREAMKWLVDYSAIGDTIMKNLGEVHQAFLPKGFLGAVNDNPYKLDVAKAKELLAKAGLPDGFSVTMDVRNTQPITASPRPCSKPWRRAGSTSRSFPATASRR